VVDIPLEGYITGEDGKVGLRGTVVERTGALLAKTALAGLASGLSFALQPRIQNSIQTGSEAGGIEYSQPDIGDMLESSAYAGVSQAMDQLAQYYLDRAEQIFPVIELDAMRTVNVHLTKGAALKPMDGATWGQLADTRK
jgi:conjugal transfer pilus assembly protein TraB